MRPPALADGSIDCVARERLEARRRAAMSDSSDSRAFGRLTTIRRNVTCGSAGVCAGSAHERRDIATATAASARRYARELI